MRLAKREASSSSCVEHFENHTSQSELSVSLPRDIDTYSPQIKNNQYNIMMSQSQTHVWIVICYQAIPAWIFQSIQPVDFLTHWMSSASASVRLLAANMSRLEDVKSLPSNPVAVGKCDPKQHAPPESRWKRRKKKYLILNIARSLGILCEPFAPFFVRKSGCNEPRVSFWPPQNPSCNPW